MIYVALDGDDVGDHIRRYFLENDEKSVAQKSKEIVEVTKQISNYLENLNFMIIFCAGDDILCKGESIDIEDFYKFLVQFDTICTFSIGISDTLERTYIALRYAKSIGKNKIVNYTSSGKLDVFSLH